MAWFLLDPRDSTVKMWYTVVTVVFWFDILTTPLLYVLPHLYQQISSFVWLCDVVWVLHICGNFITIRLEKNTRDAIDIAFSYLKGFFILDLAATLPTIVSAHHSSTHFLRVLHIVYINIVMQPLTEILNWAFPNSPYRRNKLLMFANYLVFIIVTVHFAVCLWIYIGDKYLFGDVHMPWRIANPEFLEYSDFQLYVFSVYWILVCITTVGYGDYSGGTVAEYCCSILFEFVGLLIFSIFMYLVAEVANSNEQQDVSVENKLDDLNEFILSLEKFNKPKKVSPDLFFALKKSVED